MEEYIPERSTAVEHDEDVFDGELEPVSEEIPRAISAKESLDAQGRAMLARMEIENTFLDQEIGEHYGPGFIEKLRTRSAEWSKSLQVRGDALLEWAQAKGVPLPESKRGLHVASAVSAVAGTVVPGLGFLLPVSYILWQRGSKMAGETTDQGALASSTPGVHYA